MGVMRENHTANLGAPGEALRKLFMDPLGLTAYRVSTDLQVPPIAISEILRGKRAISATMALRLGHYFGVDPQFWLALQAAQDLQTAAKQGGGRGNGQQPPAPTLPRCAALEDRSFVLRETSTAAGRQWQVLIARGKRPAARGQAGNAKHGTQKNR